MEQHHNITKDELSKLKSDISFKEYVKIANKADKKIKVNNNEYWRKFKVGKEWFEFSNNKQNGYWYKRTKKGRMKIDTPNWWKNRNNITPYVCPKCKKPMKTKESIKAYRRKGHCFYCDINELAKIETEIITKNAFKSNTE